MEVNAAASHSPWGLAPNPLDLAKLDRDEKSLLPGYLGIIYNRLLCRGSGFPAQPLRGSWSYKPGVPSWSRTGRASRLEPRLGPKWAGRGVAPRAWPKARVGRGQDTRTQPRGLGAGRRLKRKVKWEGSGEKFKVREVAPAERPKGEGSARRPEGRRPGAGAGTEAVGPVGRVGSHAWSRRSKVAAELCALIPAGSPRGDPPWGRSLKTARALACCCLSPRGRGKLQSRGS